MNPYLLIHIKQIYWPPRPTDRESTIYLLYQLPLRALVISTLEVAKMVLPIWEKSALKNSKLTKNQIEAPKKTIEAIEKWLEGKATINEVKESYVFVPIIADISPLAFAARACATSAAYCTSSAAEYRPIACRYALDTFYSATNATQTQFYNEYWIKCYPLIQKEYQNEYDILCKSIYGEI